MFVPTCIFFLLCSKGTVEYFSNNFRHNHKPLRSALYHCSAQLCHFGCNTAQIWIPSWIHHSMEWSRILSIHWPEQTFQVSRSSVRKFLCTHSPEKHNHNTFTRYFYAIHFHLQITRIDIRISKRSGEEIITWNFSGCMIQSSHPSSLTEITNGCRQQEFEFLEHLFDLLPRDVLILRLSKLRSMCTTRNGLSTMNTYKYLTLK